VGASSAQADGQVVDSRFGSGEVAFPRVGRDVEQLNDAGIGRDDQLPAIGADHALTM
jgi:hypothetical protein